MTRSSPPQLNFTSGEISPLLVAREDYARHQTGLAKCRGFIPLRQGGVTRCPGTWHRGEAPDAGGLTLADTEIRLIGFAFAEDDAVVIELTPNKARFWRYGVLVESGGSPYELPISWTLDLDRLQYVQTADVIYLVDGTNPVLRLARFALDNWTIAAADFKFGPFRNDNLDDAVTVQASAATGTITLNGVGDPFAADMVGTLIRLRSTDYSTIPLWTGNEDVPINDYRRYGDNIYQLTAGDGASPHNVGVNPPIHEEGEWNYGAPDNVVWTFVSDASGIAKITAFTDANTVTADVVKTIPKPVVDNPTYLWAEAAWSDRFGYPSAIEIHDQRLVLAGTPTDPRTIWFSSIGDFLHFEPSVEADGSFAYTIAGRNSLNRIIWLKSGSRGLHIGALGEEYSTRSDTPGQAIGPTTTVFNLDSTIGSSAVQPIAPNGVPIFISRDGARVFEMAYSYQNDANEAIELSLPAEHLGASGFVEMAEMAAPLRLTWLRRADGLLVAMVYDRQENILGLVPIGMNGHVTGICVTPSADGSRDVLTMAVRRRVTDASQYKTFIEDLEVFWNAIPETTAAYAMNFLQSATQFSQAASAGPFSVPQLALSFNPQPKTVYAWTEEGLFGPFANTGSVTLPGAVTKAIIGILPDDQEVELLPIRAAAPDGSALGRRRKLNTGSIVTVHNTGGLNVSALHWDAGQPWEIDARSGGKTETEPMQVLPIPTGSDGLELFSGSVPIELAAGPARQVSLRFTPDGAKPATILAVVPRIEESGA